METNNQKIVKPSKEKLQYVKKDLTGKINDSTEDVFRLVAFWSWWMKFRNSQSIYKILHHCRSLLFGKLEFLRQDFEKNVVLFKQLSQNFMRLTSVTGDDSMLDIEVEKQEVLAKSDLSRTYLAEASDHIAGNHAKAKVLQSDSEINFSEAENIKSDNYLDAVKNSNLETKTYPAKPKLEFSALQTQAEISEVPQKQVAVEKEKPSPAVYTQRKQVIHTMVGNAPDYYTAEEQFEEAMYASGENYNSQHSNPTKENADLVQLSTTSKEALKQPTYTQNILGHIGLDKVVWTGGTYGIAISGEVLIFAYLYKLVFNFETTESWITGLAPLLLSLGIGYGLFGTILNFTKNNNSIVKKLFSSRVLLFAMILALTYAASMGLLFKHSMDKDAVLTEMKIQKQETFQYDPAIIDDDMTEAEKNKTIREKGEKIGETNPKLIELEKGWIPTIGKLTIAFSSLVFLLFSGITFGVFILFLSSYKMRKKMTKIENLLPRIESEFYAQKNVITELDNLSKRILRLLGQKRFVEKLLAGDETKDILYTPPAKEEPKPTFSSNGTYHHSEEINSNN